MVKMNYPVKDSITSLVNVCERIVQQSIGKRNKPADSIINLMRVYNKKIVSQLDDSSERKTKQGKTYIVKEVAEKGIIDDIKGMLNKHRDEIILPHFSLITCSITLYWDYKNIGEQTPRIAVSSFYRSAQCMKTTLADELMLHFYRLIRDHLNAADQMVIDSRINQLSVRLGITQPTGAGLGQLLQGANIKEIINNISKDPSYIKNTLKTITQTIGSDSLMAIGKMAKEMMNDKDLKETFTTLTDQVKSLTGAIDEADDVLNTSVEEPPRDMDDHSDD